jgi:hypothetical protein
MDVSPCSESGSSATTEELPQRFMKPEGSLPCSQEPFTDPYSESDMV